MANTYQAVIDAINALITDTNLKIYTESVIDRLVSFGYSPTQSDAYMVAFIMEKSKSHILNAINDVSIPEGLKHIFIDMVCGEFFSLKYQSGQLELSGLDFSGVVQSVSEGDTSVTFAQFGSDEEKFAALISNLTTGRESDLICYRKIKW